MEGKERSMVGEEGKKHGLRGRKEAWLEGKRGACVEMEERSMSGGGGECLVKIGGGMVREDV